MQSVNTDLILIFLFLLMFSLISFIAFLVFLILLILLFRFIRELNLANKPPIGKGRKSEAWANTSRHGWGSPTRPDRGSPTPSGWGNAWGPPVIPIEITVTEETVVVEETPTATPPPYLPAGAIWTP